MIAEFSPLKRYRTAGERIKEVMEPTDTYLVVIMITPQTTSVRRQAFQEIAAKIPREVATPLPPENLRKMLQLWPITANPAKISGIPQAMARKVEITPLERSSARARE